MKFCDILDSMAVDPSVSSSRPPDNIVFQVHTSIDRLITRKPSRPSKAWFTAFCPKYRPPFVVVFIVAVEGGVQRRGDGTCSIFGVYLSRVLQGLRGRISRLWFVQGFIRDLYVV